MTTSDSPSWWEQLQKKMEEQIDWEIRKALYECSPPYELRSLNSTRNSVSSQELTLEVLQKAHNLLKGMTSLTIYVSDYAPDTEVFYELTNLEGWDLLEPGYRPSSKSNGRTVVGSRKALAALFYAWGVTVQPEKLSLLPVGVKVVMPSERGPQ
jgi:hypothetical protein